MGNSSMLVRDAITHVRNNYQFWNRSEGADHFMVFAYDKGRCEQVRHPWQRGDTLKVAP